MDVTLCVMLWARAGRERELVAYEDRVLMLVPEHGGEVVARARAEAPSDDAPLEVHLIRFPSQQLFDDYLGDERRVAMADERDRAIARTEVTRVDLV